MSDEDGGQHKVCERADEEAVENMWSLAYSGFEKGCKFKIIFLVSGVLLHLPVEQQPRLQICI